MTSKFTFNFYKSNSEYFYEIENNIKLRLYRYNNSVAILEFIDGLNNIIPIPSGIKVFTDEIKSYDDDPYGIKDTPNKKVLLKPTNNIYALNWTDDYTIELNDKDLLYIDNVRCWDISTPLKRKT